jgi:hypothetical protein
MFGKQHRVDTIVKMSIAKGGSIIYVYDTQSILVNSFSSARKAAEYFNVNKGTGPGPACFNLFIIPGPRHCSGSAGQTL